MNKLILCLSLLVPSVAAAQVSIDPPIDAGLQDAVQAPAAATGSAVAPPTVTTTTTTVITNAAPPTPESDLDGFLRALYVAATAGKWKVFAGFALLGLVYLSRRFLFGRIAWFKTRMGGVTLAMIVSLGGTFGLALASGAAVTMTAALSAVATAVTAAGLWTWLQDAMKPKAKAA
jgi:hypothetical protein